MSIGEDIKRYWPLPRSLDLVCASFDVVSDAVLTEVSRFAGKEALTSGHISFASLGHLFGSVSLFTNVPTVFFVLPTHSDWTVFGTTASFATDMIRSVTA
jgi:hypothetical protein